MRGKRPKERKCYILRAGDGTVVEVTREVYLEWYQSRRRERYQNEKKQKYGVFSLEDPVGERNSTRWEGRQPGRDGNPGALCGKNCAL